MSMELSATAELAEDGVHENVTVTHTENGVTKVTKGCTLTVTTDEWGKHFEVVTPDLATVTMVRHTP